MNTCCNTRCNSPAKVKGQCTPCYKFKYDTGRAKIIRSIKDKPVVPSDGTCWIPSVCDYKFESFYEQ